MRAIKKCDLENILYYQTPKWLFDLLLSGEITPGAYTTYILMYDRTRLSAKNNWIDKNGDVYIKYSYEEMLEDLQIRSNTQIQRNLRKLEELNLIDKKKNYSSSTTYYLNIYSPTQNVSISPTQNVSISPTQNVSISPTQNVETSKNNYNKNNNINNNYNKIDADVDIEREQTNQSILNYISIVSGATGTNLYQVQQVINIALLRNYDINMLIMKIKESDFLLGLLDSKPTIRNFTQKSMIDKILADFYRNNVKKEKKTEMSVIDRMLMEEEAKLG